MSAPSSITSNQGAPPPKPHPLFQEITSMEATHHAYTLLVRKQLKIIFGHEPASLLNQATLSEWGEILGVAGKCRHLRRQSHCGSEQAEKAGQQLDTSDGRGEQSGFSS